MNGLFLIARVANEIVALPTASIGSVVEVDQIAPVPRVAAHIAGLFALRSRVLTVIDSSVALGRAPVERGDATPAIIVDRDGHSYALLVDDVEDVIEADGLDACPSVLADGWRRAALGTIRRDERAVLVVDPAALIAGPEPIAA